MAHPSLILWGIHSHIDQADMRQAQRDTFLSNDWRVCPLIADEYIKKSKDCDVFYTFLVTADRDLLQEWGKADDVPQLGPPIIKDHPLLEPDVAVLRTNRKPGYRALAWLVYATSIFSNLDTRDNSAYVVHTNVDVMVTPQLILDNLMRKDEHGYQFYDTYPPFDPDYKAKVKVKVNEERRRISEGVLEFGTSHLPFEMPDTAACVGRRLPWVCPDLFGRFMVFSKDLAKALSVDDTESVEGDDQSTFDEEIVILNRVRARNYTMHKRYSMGWFGAARNARGIRDGWIKQSTGRKGWQAMMKKTGSKFITVTGKFGRRPGMFADEVSLHKYVLTTGGIKPEYIVPYDSFPPSVVHDKRWQQHLEFLYNSNETEVSPRGGGYWFWKPLIILDALERVREGDFVLYSDADNPDEWSWLHRVLVAMDERQHNVAGFWLNFNENEWNKKDVYDRYCANRDQLSDDTRQYWGAQLFLRKSPGVMEFVRHWAKDVEEYHLINDAASVKPNIDNFKEHRHDQSVMSLLLQCRYHNRHFTKLYDMDAPRHVSLYSMDIIPTADR